MRTLDVLAINRRVMDYTVAHPYERDCWEKAPAMSGVLVWNEADAVAAVQTWMDRAVETQTSNGDLSYSDTLDLPAGHVRTFSPTSSLSASLGYPLLLLYQRTNDPAYLAAATLQAEGLLRTKRTSEGGFWARQEGPELWVDFLYMMCPFLLLYAKVTGKSDFADEAFKQYAVHTRHLVDPHTGLVRHAWCEKPNHFPQSTFWGRGNGWLTCVSIDILSLAPDHAEADYVRKTVTKALESMAALQDRSGYFRHVLDDPKTKFEASCTLMFAYAAARAVQLGLLDDSYLDRAERALRVVAGSVEPSGAIPGVAIPPGGPGVPFSTALFGQGFYMLAAHALKSRLQT